MFKKNLLLKLSLGLVIACLIFARLYVYMKYGVFGFGFDYGIYKHEFESLLSFKDVVFSQIYFIPAFIAFALNKFGVPMHFYLDYFYLFLCVLAGLSCFYVAKRQFGLRTAVVALMIFTVSYVQVFAAQFYLFKAVFSASFFVLGMYLYSVKSYFFIPVISVVALTQLPQFLILAFATGVCSLIDYRKNKKFIILLWSIFAVIGCLLLVVFGEQVRAGVDLVWKALLDSPTTEKHQSGLFVNLKYYLSVSYWIFVPAVIGLFLLLRKQLERYLVYLIGIGSLLLIIWFKLFFEDRYVFELDLLLIPFAAYFIVDLYKLISSKFVKGIYLFVLISWFVVLNFYYFSTSYPSLNSHEAWGVEVIQERTEADKVLVLNTSYATWMYGFSDKTVLSPGMFESVWNFEEWAKFNQSDDEGKRQALREVYEKYGTYYLYVGRFDKKIDFTNYESQFQKLYDIGGVAVYLVK
jgi:hypothetical protein